MANISDQEFDNRLKEKLSKITADQLLSIPGIYELVSEELNNEIIEEWEQDQEKITFHYFIDLDERGEFYADIRDNEGNTVYEIKTNEEGTIDLIDNGFIKNTKDLLGLEKYLKKMNIIPHDSKLVYMDLKY